MPSIKKLFTVGDTKTGKLLRDALGEVVYYNTKVLAKAARDSLNADVANPHYWAVFLGPEHRRFRRVGL